MKHSGVPDSRANLHRTQRHEMQVHGMQVDAKT